MSTFLGALGALRRVARGRAEGRPAGRTGELDHARLVGATFEPGETVVDSVTGEVSRVESTAFLHEGRPDDRGAAP